MSRRKRIVGFVFVLLVCAAMPAGIYHRRQQDQHERALIAAVLAGNERQVQAELRWGVDPNTRDMPDAPTDWRNYVKRLFRRQSAPNWEQYTPALLLAELHAHRYVARMLLQAGADPNATDSKGTRPLMLALVGSTDYYDFQPSDAETALLMLAKGADPNTHDSEHTALEAALSHNERDVVWQLILRGANIHARGPNGESLLTHAASDLYLTALMLSKGADINAADQDGNTVLMDAEENMTPLLLARGADVHAKNVHGKTALRIAADRNEPDKVRWLLKYGADCAPMHKDGWNLLCWSVAQGLPDITRMAMTRGIKVNTRNGVGHTPLMFAAAKGDVAMVGLLLAQGASVNVQDDAGMTPLMYAAQGDKVAVVQQLLRRGANSRLKDRKQKWTAAQRAQHLGCENDADLLRTGTLPPPLPADANSGGESKRSRIRVDANHWLVRTLLPCKDAHDSTTSADFRAYSFCLVDSAGRRSTPIVEHYLMRAPAMLAFRDVDGQRYVYVEGHDGANPYGIIYLAKGHKLFRKWDEDNRDGLDCVPLPHGGALIRKYKLDHYSHNQPDVYKEDGSIEVSRFRNGVMESFGAFDTPGV